MAKIVIRVDLNNLMTRSRYCFGARWSSGPSGAEENGAFNTSVDNLPVLACVRAQSGRLSTLVRYASENPRSSLLKPREAGVGKRALQEFGAAGVVFGEVAAVERIEHVLHGDVAGELRDAMRHTLVVTHREVGGKARVNASAIRRADDDDRDMPAAENRQDVLEVGGKAAVGDDDCRMVGTRGERRTHLGLSAVVARCAFAGGEQAVAEHSCWIEVVRARVDVDLSGVCDELGGVVKLRGVE